MNWKNWNVTSFRIAEVDTTTVSFFRPDSFDENVFFTSCPQIETESARNTQINHICDSAGGGRKSSICLGFLLAGANCVGYSLIYQGCLRHGGDQPLEVGFTVNCW